MSRPEKEVDEEFRILVRKRQILTLNTQEPLEDTEWGEWKVTAGYNKDGPPVYRQLNHARCAINQLRRYPKKFWESEYKIERRTVMRGQWRGCDEEV